MARISTGQSYGNTDQQTSQRLVGGLEQVAAGGELAQRQIAPAAIQPQAAPVNTFQQVGAPTLGGPVKFFAPPDLPGPNQDLAVLARSLGQFSTTLSQFGEFYGQEQKRKQEEADLATKQIAQDLSVAFPGQHFAQIRDTLYKKASEGDADARQKYEMLRAMGGMELSFVQRNLERALMANALATAPDRWAHMATVTGPDGQPIAVETLAPGDPLLRQAMVGLLPQISDPVVAAEFAPQVQGLAMQLNAAQAKVRNNHLQRQGEAAVLAMLEAASMAGNTADGAAMLGNTLNEWRIKAGPEGYAQLVQSLPGMVETLLKKNGLRVGKDPDAAAAYGAKMQALLIATPAGPNGDSLYKSLGLKGGAAMDMALYGTMMDTLRQAKADVETNNSIRAGNVVDSYIQQAGLNDPNLSPTERNQRVLALGQQLTAQLGGNPALLQEAMSQLNTRSNTISAGIDRPRQELAKQELFNIAYGPGDPNEKLKAMDRLVARGDVEGEVAQQYRKVVEDQQRQIETPFGREAEASVKDLEKRLRDSLAPGGLTVEEVQQVNRNGTAWRQGVQELIQYGHANRKTSAEIADMVRQYLKKEGERVTKDIAGRSAPSATQASVQDPERYASTRGAGRAPRGQELQAAVDNGIIFPPAVYDKALEQYISNKNDLPPGVGQVIKDAGYGGRAGDFFIKQWQRVHPGWPMPTDMDRRLRDLNGQQVSFVQSTSARGLAMIMPLDLHRAISQAANAFMQPASAATMETPGRVSVVVGDKGGLAATVSSGEGGWNSINHGTTGSAGQMPLTRMTIGQVEKLQSQGRIFAAGAYQFTPGVLARARRDSGLSPSDPMTPENQTKMFFGLALGGKRPKLAAYLRGESNDLNGAHRELALEWAGVKGPNGRGAHDRDAAGNLASVSADRVRQALIAARQQLSGR